jgi:hypothetical protein
MLTVEFSEDGFSRWFQDRTLAETQTRTDALAAWLLLAHLAVVIAACRAFKGEKTAADIIAPTRLALERHWNLPTEALEKFRAVLKKTEIYAVTTFFNCRSETDFYRFFDSYLWMILGEPSISESRNGDWTGSFDLPTVTAMYQLFTERESIVRKFIVNWRHTLAALDKFIIERFKLLDIAEPQNISRQIPDKSIPNEPIPDEPTPEERFDPAQLDSDGVARMAKELRAKIEWSKKNGDAGLKEPYHLFFFRTVDRDRVTRFFDVMDQEGDFSVAETATSVPRLAKCVETTYKTRDGRPHHAHRNYGTYRSSTAQKAMQHFASVNGLTSVIQIAETSTPLEASPTWDMIFAELGCPALDFAVKEADHS